MSTLAYRRDVDGLRAVAVLAVVGYHAFPNFVRGGFVGVDVFFVISGYLITGILQRDTAATGVAAIAGFYARRIRRILPTLILVLGASLLFGWIVLLPGEFIDLGRHAAAAATFSSNFVLWREAGYFDAAADSKLLLHLWSLAIEEQFYLVFPLLMLGLLPRRPGLRGWVLGTLALASFALNVVELPQDPTGSFYSPLTRAWELLAGSLLWVAQHPRGEMPADRGRRARLHRMAWLLSLAGAMLIAYATVNFDRSQPYPGARALVPALGAVLIIAAGPHNWINRRLLGSRWAVGTGLISYPLYLWHWPVLKFHLLANGELVSAAGRLGLIALSAVLAWASYVGLERRIRRRPIGWVPALLGALLVTGVMGGLAATGTIVPRQSATGLEPILHAATDWQFPPPRFRATFFEGRRFYVQRSAHPETVLFIGDSNMQQYAPRLSALLAGDPQTHETVVFATRGGCLPIPDLPSAPPDCRGHLESALHYAERSEVNRVVLGGYWLNIPPGAARTEAMPALERLIARLAATKQVFLLMNIPAGPEFDPRNMFEGSRFGQLRTLPNPPALPMAQFLDEYGELRSALRSTAANAGAVPVDPVPWLCTPDRCPVMSDDGQPLYMDSHHMRPFHALQATGYLDALVRVPEPGHP